MGQYRDKGDNAAMADFLARSRHERNETLWLVAQAISEILPDGDKEKQLLQGLLKRLRMYGALIADHVCELSYTGAESVYFRRYLPVFKEVVASATVVPR